MRPDLLASRAALSGGAIAIEDVASGAVTTFAELDAQAGRIAAWLIAMRLQPDAGDPPRVGLLARNRADFFAWLFGAFRAGVILVPLNWRMPAAELASQVDHADPALLIHDAAMADAAAGASGGRPCVALDAARAVIDDLRPAPTAALWDAAQPWYLLYTSGTTGSPKAVVYTPAMAVANQTNVTTAIGLRSGDAVPAFLPFFHTAGINLHALPVLLAGGRVLLCDGFDADRIVGLLTERRIDHLFAVPTVYHDLLAHPGFASAPLDHVRHWGSGGAPLPDRIAMACRGLGIRLCGGMGMTETGPTALLQAPSDAWEKIGSVGRPQLLCAARVVDGNGVPVRPGEVGEIVFSGPAVMSGYWRDETATRAVFGAGGWLRSGDLGRVDEDGHFYVVGRRKEMFISGGEKVYPAEVERVLSAHPSVADAAVRAMPDLRWGEVGMAFVQLRPGADTLLGDDLSAYCRARLAGYKVPKAFRFVEAFPRTAAGKIQKHLLA